MSKITLAKINTRAPKSLDKAETKAKTAEIIAQLDELQNRLFAESKHSILVILQGMDASGKDGAIRNVLGNMNPQGVKVHSFKTPTTREQSQDFLWRVHQHAPQKGMIQVFNRSHYEDVLITRVHGWCDDKTARLRMKAINDFEDLLETHNNTKILKFYLHISPERQMERLKERLVIPSKMWKYNANDIEEAKRWDEYMKMYEDCITHCNKPAWIITPADQNWYKEYIIAQHLYDTLISLNMQYPGLKP